jgi:hypothetical protein
MLGRHAQQVVLRSSEIEHLLKEGKDEEASAKAIELSAYVVSCCLLDDDGERLAFEQGAAEAVLSDLPMHLIRACSDACMDDAGLSDDREIKPVEPMPARISAEKIA